MRHPKLKTFVEEMSAAPALLASLQKLKIEILSIHTLRHDRGNLFLNYSMLQNSKNFSGTNRGLKWGSNPCN